MNNSLGILGERLVADRLVAAGWTIIAKNERTRFGELDLIATEGAVLVFCEVKTRRSSESARRGPASALEAIGPRKQLQVRRLAMAWLADYRSAPDSERQKRCWRDIRFDAFGVELDRDDRLITVDHVRNAF